MRKELIDAGFRWLTSVPQEHASWGAVWRELLKAPESDEAVLLKMGRRWLETVTISHGSWGGIFSRVAERGLESGDEALALSALDWLANTPPENLAWSYAWTVLWRAHFRSEELTTLACNYLRESPKNIGWPHVWRELLERNQDDEGLQSQERAWLSRARLRDPAPPIVWLPLWERCEGADLAIFGVQWLRRVGLPHRKWALVWSALWSRDRGNGELMALGRRWLANSPAGDDGRRAVTDALSDWECGSWPEIQI